MQTPVIQCQSPIFPKIGNEGTQPIATIGKPGVKNANLFGLCFLNHLSIQEPLGWWVAIYEEWRQQREDVGLIPGVGKGTLLPYHKPRVRYYCTEYRMLNRYRKNTFTVTAYRLS